jgi:hypothetical protein
MNAKELIQAAHRVNAKVAANDSQALVQYAIDNVREDDDEPITDEWLCKICIRTDGDWDYWQLAKLQSCSDCNVSYQDGWYYLRVSLFRVRQVSTRGQLRKLLEVLGAKQ